MNDRIQKLLQRELEKFERLSLNTETPLQSNDVRSLDTLIKAYRTFSAPPQSSPVSPAGADPASASTESLLSDVTSEPAAE